LLLFVVHLIEFPLIILALLDEVAVAVDVNMKVFVEFDDAFEHASLFFDRAVGNSETVRKLNVPISRVLVSVPIAI
jgi:hypothetical protein